MTKYRIYWIFSVRCLVVWGILLAVVGAKGSNESRHNALLVFGGWAIAWVSTTIARFVYPPPKRWLREGSPLP